MNEYEIVNKKIKIDENKSVTIKLINDHFENAKRYNIPRAQLIIADIPYNLGNNAYASNPQWYVGGDNKNGESKLAGKSFFDTDNDFKINNFFDFCTRYLKKEPTKKVERGKSSDAPAKIIFCAFEQIPMVIEQGKKHGLKKSYPLVFVKNFSAQVLKANMKIVNACEYAVVLYRERLPTVNVLEKLIQVFTDEGDVIIDPVAGSASTLKACENLKRNCYGFEIKKDFCKKAKEQMLNDDNKQISIFDI